MNVKTKRNYKIILEPIAANKIDVIVDLSKDEVGFLGSVEKENDETYVIKDIFLFDQEVSASTCIIDEKSLSKLGTEILKKYDSETGMKFYNSIRFWGHSHVGMGVYPSGQDDTQIDELSKDCDDFYIMGIFNKKNEAYFELHLVKEGLYICDVPYSIRNIEKDELYEVIEEELKSKVRKTIVYGKYYSPKYNYGYGNKNKSIKKTKNYSSPSTLLESVEDIDTNLDKCGFGIDLAILDEYYCDLCHNQYPKLYARCKHKLSFDMDYTNYNKK